MENTNYIGLSKQVALQRQLDITANNIANVNTRAYREDKPMFRQYLSSPPNPQNRTSFVYDTKVYRNQAEGTLKKTSEQLDFALHGDGFFVTQNADKTARQYSRDGMFHIDQNRILLNHENKQVVGLDENKREIPIQIPEGVSDIVVRNDGTIADETGAIIANFKLVRFDKDGDLKKVGENNFEAKKELEKDAPQTEVIQGMLEESNVNPVTAMTDMMQVTRNYEAMQRMMDAENDRQMKYIQYVGTR